MLTHTGWILSGRGSALLAKRCSTHQSSEEVDSQRHRSPVERPWHDGATGCETRNGVSRRALHADDRELRGGRLRSPWLLGAELPAVSDHVEAIAVPRIFRDEHLSAGARDGSRELRDPRPEGPRRDGLVG